MGSEIVLFITVFGAMFGIAYLFFSTRNKERLALIEKGADASIFIKGKEHSSPIWKVLILNLSLLLIGVGIGIFVASILHNYMGLEQSVAFPGTIFLMAGIGLFTGLTLTKRMAED